MKKVYAFIIASLAVSAMSASTINPVKPSRSFENSPIHQLNGIKTIDQSKIAKCSALQANQVAVSRDGEEEPSFTPYDVNPAKFTQYLRYDYFFNWTEPDGVTDIEDDEGFRYIQTGGYQEIVDNGDDTFTVMNFCDYTDFNFDIYRNDEGFFIDMGQIVAEGTLNDGSPAKLILCTVTDQGKIDTQSTVGLYYGKNFLYSQGYLGVYLMSGREGLGFYLLNFNNIFIEPNATLSYSFGEGKDKEEVSIDVYGEIVEPQEGQDFDPYLMISNIMPFNYGTSVEFEFLTIGLDEIMLAYNQVAYPSYEMQDGSQSGDWFMSSCTFEADPTQSEEGVYFLEVIAEQTADNEFTWPAAYEAASREAGYWFLNSYAGWLYPMFNSAKLTFKLPEDGISDIATDVDAAPVYYNIQGMRVNNPQAGQLYIVKQGNKVSKVIK